MAVLLQVMLNGGSYKHVSLFNKRTADLFTTAASSDPTFALGWRKNGDPDMEWMFGPYASRQAYGHTGWTGTITIIDPAYKLGIALLTNKKHSPSSVPVKTRMFLKGIFSDRKLRRRHKNDL